MKLPGLFLYLGGGGGRGSYEIGVWKALEEYRDVIDIKAVSGSSVGALNAALYACGDLDKATQMWYDITLPVLTAQFRVMHLLLLRYSLLYRLMKLPGLFLYLLCSLLKLLYNLFFIHILIPLTIP